MLPINTHSLINRELSGEPKDIGEGFAVVRLKTTKNMVADESGLIHGGFIFSAADYSAMLCVNHPNVVLASAQVSFLKPVRLGEEIEFRAKIKRKEGKKVWVDVIATREDEKVFEGTFLCVVPSKHVLSD